MRIGRVTGLRRAQSRGKLAPTVTAEQVVRGKVEVIITTPEEAGRQPGHVVLRSVNSTAPDDFAEIGLLEPGDFSYEDSSEFPNGSTLRYRVVPGGPGSRRPYYQTPPIVALADVPAPHDFTATNGSAGTIDFAWDQETPETVLNFEIERTTVAVPDEEDWSRILTPALEARSANDATAASGTTYYYRMRAIHAFGVSDWTPTRTVTTPGGPSPPGDITNFLASAPTHNNATLTWTKSPTAGAVTRVYLSTTGATYPTGYTLQETMAEGVQFKLATGLSPSTNYWFVAVPFTTAGGAGNPTSPSMITTGSAGTLLGAPYYQTAHDRVPNLAYNPDIWTVSDGNASNGAIWSSPLVENATVEIRHDVNWNLTSAPYLKAVTVLGTITLAAGSRLRVVTCLVPPDGTLEGDDASLSFPDVALDLVNDPSMYGNGLLVIDGVCNLRGQIKAHRPRIAGDLLAGATSVTLKTAATGWLVGDKITIPHTAQRTYSPNPAYPWQIFTVTSISPDRLTIGLSEPVVANRYGSVLVDGVQEFTGEVLNLTRSMRVYSENPAGVRHHIMFTNRADVTLTGVEMYEGGRTTVAAVNNTRFNANGTVAAYGTNQVGRYPCHWHHCNGSLSAFGEGRPQWKIRGCSVWSEVDSNNKIWGLTIHDTHFGEAVDNVFYNWGGSCITEEIGNETGNSYRGNAISRCLGLGHRLPDGRNGALVWLTPWADVYQNTCSNSITGETGPGITLSNVGVSVKGIPPGPGSASRVQTDVRTIPITRFEENESYAMNTGFSFWNIGTRTVGGEGAAGTMRNNRHWHISSKGVYFYPTGNLVIDGWIGRGNTRNVVPANWSQTGFYFGDYTQSGLVLRNLDFRYLGRGFEVVGSTGGTVFTIEDSDFGTGAGIRVILPWTVGDPYDLLDREVVVRNCRLISVPQNGSTPNVLVQKALTYGGLKQNAVVSSSVTVYDFNGTPGDDFKVYASQQAANFIMPQGTALIVASPVSGLTNQQNLDTHGVCTGGEVTPADAISRTGIFGMTKAVS